MQGEPNVTHVFTWAGDERYIKLWMSQHRVSPERVDKTFKELVVDLAWQLGVADEEGVAKLKETLSPLIAKFRALYEGAQ